jgi:hypothetical protein
VSGPPIGPRHGFLELSCQPEEGCLVAVPRSELNPDRETGVIPMKRHRHGRLAGQVEKLGIGHRVQLPGGHFLDGRIQYPASRKPVDHLYQAEFGLRGGEAAVQVVRPVLVRR